MTFIQKTLISIVLFLATLYARTWRYELHNRKAYDDLRKIGIKPVMAIWHDQLLPCTFLHRNEGMVTIASDSKDGEIITFALSRWGFNTARGSASKGGVKAALSAIKMSNQHSSACAVTVDGPRGPRHKVKSGAVFIAKKLDKVIVIGIMSTKRFIKFKSWDKFILPLPFAKVHVTYSEPVYVTDDVEEEALKNETQTLQDKMLEQTNANSPLFI